MELRASSSRAARAIGPEERARLDLELLEAVKLGTAREVEDLVNRGADVEQTDSRHNQNLVFFAASRRSPPLGGRISILKVLVEKFGLDAAAVDRQMGQTPLFFAARQGDTEACDFLIEKRGQPDHVDVKHWHSPLFYAARWGHVECVRLLLERRAAVDRCDNKEKTPLFWAALEGCAGVMRLLLERKASINQLSSERRTCLFDAKGEAVRAAVAARCDPNHRDWLCQTALFAAAAAGDVEKVQILVKLGTQLNAVDIHGHTCLFSAARFGNNAVLEALCFELGADVAHRNKEGDSALKVAHHFNKRQAAQILERAEKKRQHDAKKLQKQKESDATQTLEEQLYRAVEEGTVAEVSKLLQQGARLTTVGNGQNLAFLAAARVSKEARPICEVLSTHGVDLDQVDQQWQQTPLFFAVRPYGEAAAKNSGVDDDADCARFLVEARAMVDRRDINGHTALFYAVKRHEDTCVKLLLDARASAHSTDLLSKTPLFFAAEQGTELPLRAMLERRANPSACDIVGKTALFYAKTTAVAELLVAAKCSVSVQDSDGRTCLFSAAERGSHELLRALRDLKGDVNTTDKLGETCLFAAVKIADTKAAEAMCKLLVKDSGASVAQQNVEEETPADVAVSKSVRDWLTSMAAHLARASPTDSDVLTDVSRKRSSTGYGEEDEPRQKYRIAVEDASGKMLLPGMPGYSDALRDLCQTVPGLKCWGQSST